jgi:HNH/ENDO VII superfamily nuclease
MTELLEPVILGQNNHADHDKKTCAFCTRKVEQTTETNDLIDEFDEDECEVHAMEKEGIAHKNSAGKLGKSLIKYKSKQPEYMINVEGVATELPVQSAAHHLIPGNASLKHKTKGECKLYKYLHVDGTKKGNIGYSVNNYENGVWLVGNYGIRKSKGLVNWGSSGCGFQSKFNTEPYEYAKKAIEASQSQFHDAHENYSDNVRLALDAIAEKIGVIDEIWCDEDKSDRPTDPDDLQLVALVNRLNTTSRRLQTLLTKPGENWKTNFYTSSYSLKYIEKEIYGKEEQQPVLKKGRK